MTRMRPCGGYRMSASFQTATLIYDATYWFCEKFLDSRSRTVDQMIQTARSGRQNIAEGSRASAVSSNTEHRLTNVARTSLEELLLDQQVAALESAFIEDGGYSENLAAARLGHRKKTIATYEKAGTIPPCPKCGQSTVLRTATSGKNAGGQFWGCTAFPNC